MILFLTTIYSSKSFDSKSSVKEYSDIDLITSVDLLLKDSDSKDFVDRATMDPLHIVIEKFRIIEKQFDFPTIIKKILGIHAEGVTTSKIEFKGAEIIQREKIAQYKSDNSKAIATLEKFLADNFYPVGYDIEPYDLPDFKEDIPLFEEIKNKKVSLMARSLHNTWKILSRKAKDIGDGSSSLLNLPHPFMIPGGRFREFYYWDTYWILEGLLVSNLYQTCENILRNFIHIIKTLGYIPNGTRKYYTGRSQPPFFPKMLYKLLETNQGYLKDLILSEGLDMAIKEFEYFDKYKSIEVTDQSGETHKLYYYHVNTDFPRPESLAEDLETYKKQNSKSEDEIYSGLKSAAESGWDFSSRWLRNSTDLRSIDVSHQIPVDLNAIIFHNLQILSALSEKRAKIEKNRNDDENSPNFPNKADVNRNSDKSNSNYNKYLLLSVEYRKRSQDLEKSINAILWNKKEKIWQDYRTKSNEFVNNRFYFSNITPIIYRISIPDSRINIFNILKKYRTELFGYKGGIPASGAGRETAQQWDFPNAWAPHQHMFAEFLISEKYFNMASHVAKSFFNNAWIAYSEKNYFFEKYNVEDLGKTGEGGEYIPQTGFGWTNGTLLSFIQYFKDDLVNWDHQKSYDDIKTFLIANSKSVTQNTFDVGNMYEITPLESIYLAEK